MNHILTGQKSYQPTHAFTFSSILSKIALCVLLCMILPFGLSANSIDSHPVDRSVVEMEGWAVTLQLACPIGSEGFLSVKEFYQNKPAFAGFSAEVVLGQEGESISVYFFGPAQTMAPGEEIAVITVCDPACGGEVNYRLSTDGGGIMIIIDEF